MDKYPGPATAAGLKNCTSSLKVGPRSCMAAWDGGPGGEEGGDGRLQAASKWVVGHTLGASREGGGQGMMVGISRLKLSSTKFCMALVCIDAHRLALWRLMLFCL